jgi:ribosome-associated protein
VLQSSAFSHILAAHVANVQRPMLRISDNLSIPETELSISPVRSRGPGGQHVNKVSTAVRLQFDIGASTALPDEVKERLLALSDHRISATGIVNFKVQDSRSQEHNRQLARERLVALIQTGLVRPKPRKKTRPGKKAVQKRLDDKARRSRLKQSRTRPSE